MSVGLDQIVALQSKGKFSSKWTSYIFQDMLNEIREILVFFLQGMYNLNKVDVQRELVNSLKRATLGQTGPSTCAHRLLSKTAMFYEFFKMIL